MTFPIVNINLCVTSNYQSVRICYLAIMEFDADKILL